MQQNPTNNPRKKQKLNILQQQFKRIDCNLSDGLENEPKNWRSYQEKDNYCLGYLRKQIEYYLSDVNLRNDKFFRQLVEQDNFVCLTKFLKCNKIRKIFSQYYPMARETQQLAILVEALKSSRLLIISKDEKSIKRQVQLELDEQSQKDIDERTIYVERLPKQIDNEKLYEIFKNVGQVTEAKVSRHKETKISKGFGFVTFSHFTSAIQAVERYNNCIPKEIQQMGIYTNCLRVVLKIQWNEMKQEAKDLLSELREVNKALKQEKNKEIQQQYTLRLVGVKYTPIVEEVRAALGHAVFIKSIKLLIIENDHIIIQMKDEESKHTLTQNIQRIRNYSTQFQNCELLDLNQL